MLTKYSIKERANGFIECDKSKFYGIIFPSSSKEDFNSFLDSIKKEYPKATHYCYAYIIKEEKKSSDNGEPSGTAGKPLLNILEMHDLTNVGIIVVRYFGGTLLGAGRLTRTYSEAAKVAYNNAKIMKITEKVKVRVSLTIDVYNSFLNFLNKKCYIVLKTLFNDKIILDFLADKDFKKDELEIFLKKVEFIGEIPYEYMEEI